MGVLNALMENKGILQPEEWRRFCGATVVMARLPRFVLTDGDPLTFSVCVSECDPQAKHRQITCELYEGDDLLARGIADASAAGSRVIECGEVTLGIMHAASPRYLTLRLTLDDGTAVNEYPLWVFPEGEAVITRQGIHSNGQFVRFAATEEEGRQAEGPVIIVPDAADKLPAEYCADFWCYSMFRDISDWMKKPRPVGTMGLCIDTTHPMLAGFPCQEWTTPPWYRLLAHAHCEPLSEACELPVQMIDNVTRARRLGILWAKDGIVHTTLRLW